MRRALVWVVVAGCSSAPTAERRYYALEAGSTFNGAPSTATLDASFVGEIVSMLSGTNQGFGLRRPDGAYDMIFYHHKPAEQTFPRQQRWNDTSLLVIHRDGRGKLVRPPRWVSPFRCTFHGPDELVLDGSVGHTLVHLAPDGTARFSGALSSARSAVYARFGDDLLIAVSFDGAYSNLSVGRYDFTRGHGETASPRGRGIETFARMR